MAKVVALLYNRLFALAPSPKPVLKDAAAVLYRSRITGP
jgi:hypothetical protein